MRKTKEKFIVILSLKTDVPPILGGFGEWKESTKPLIYIRIPGLWNDYDGVRGVYPLAFKSLRDQRLNINTGINRDLGYHMEAWLLVSELLG